MSRPRKQTADYFPHYINGVSQDESRLLYMLEERFGNDGYAAWYKLQEILAGTEGHCYHINRPPDNWPFLVTRFKLDEVRTRKVLDFCARVNGIDAELWEEGRIWSQLLVDKLGIMYARRSTEVPEKPEPEGVIDDINGGLFGFSKQERDSG